MKVENAMGLRCLNHNIDPCSTIIYIYIYTYTFNHVYNSLSYVHYIIDCQKILEVTSSLCPDQENLIRYFFLFQILMACENSDSAPQTMQIDPLKLLAWGN